MYPILSQNGQPSIVMGQNGPPLVYGSPGSQNGLPLPLGNQNGAPIPNQNDYVPGSQNGGVSPLVLGPLGSQNGALLPPANQNGVPAQGQNGGLPGPQNGPQNGAGHDIEAVIHNLGIHPQSGLAQAFRAIHAALTQHLVAQLQHAASAGTYPHALFNLGAPVHQRPGPVLQ
jgi:hypothetical protein